MLPVIAAFSAGEFRRQSAVSDNTDYTILLGNCDKKNYCLTTIAATI